MEEKRDLVHPLEAFGVLDCSIYEGVSYWYEGHCPRTGDWLKLPRTELAEAIARGLMQELAEEPEFYSREGKMYGVLLVEGADGLGVLKAFSGLLNGQRQVAGWVPPIFDPAPLAAETNQTLTRLDQIKQALLELQQTSIRQDYADLKQQFDAALSALTNRQQQAKQLRQQQRQQLNQTLSGPELAAALDVLDHQSQMAGIERRRLKQQWQAILQPLQQQIAQIEAQTRQLKQERRQLSRQLQTQMHHTYRVSNFAGLSASLAELVLGTGRSLPTGTGDCCAPKLLHWAAVHDLKPLAMAEFWWGGAELGRIPGEFYAACEERCQPLLGFLLSGLGSSQPVPILYEDEWVVAIQKPAGLLSVPGRAVERQDSAISRIKGPIWPVHRLDQGTSGILLLARDPATQRLLRRQFQQRQVSKIYEAILVGTVAAEQGTIDLPLWGDPAQRPRQQVDWQQGKPSQTQFRILERLPAQTRIELVPITGRTHQLRVHAAEGLKAPIWGDRLYGSFDPVAPRLHLHARELEFRHPHSQELLHLQTATPF